MLLEGMKIGVALTGSFCTIGKVIPEIEKMIKEGGEVFPIISETVDTFDTRFGKAEEWKNTLKELTGKEIITSIIKAEPLGPKGILDVLLVAPCTGNTLSKLANAITDSTVTMACKAHLRNQKPLVIGISTNDGLSNNGKNIGTLLNMKNVYMVPYGQDDPEKKCNSLVAKMELIIPTLIKAREGTQLQPILM